MSESSVGDPAAKPDRLVSLDAYRGFIMLAMASGGLGFAAMAQKDGFSGSPLWQALAFQFEHVPWVGCSFWDLIQPSFMFMVGVALPYSYAGRKARGESERRVIAHAVVRAAVLILLGIFLSSNGARETNFTFANVLTQIGLGYVFLYFLLGRGPRVQGLTVAGILAGYWLLFVLTPLPPAGFPYATVGLPDDWPHLQGLFAHWDKNANFASYFDVWFLNLFPRSHPFRFSEGGYATLNFVPSLATMILGLMAGELLRKPSLSPRQKFLRLALAGVGCLAAGAVLGETLCPIVKRIWTPSWVLSSAGWTFAMLAAFFWVIDVRGRRGWAFPLAVVGMNSIAMYCMSQTLKPWTRRTLQTHLGQDIFQGDYAPVVQSLAVLAVLWLFCFWMYRQKIFVRI
jgi:predicted acyltransferase